MSFHFTNIFTGVHHRLRRSDPPHAAHGRQAELYQEYDECPHHQAAICAMVDFMDPRAMNEPQNMIFTEQGKAIVVQERYDDFKHGARCALSRVGAHNESAARRDPGYKPSGEVVPDSLLDEYATTGRAPAILSGVPVAAPPYRVIFELGNARDLQSFTLLPEIMKQAVKAHREFYIEIVHITCRGSSVQTREIIHSHNKSRGKMELFKMPGEDPGNAIGLLELELRKA